MSRKLGVFDRNLEGSPSPLYCYFDDYHSKYSINMEMMSSSLKWNNKVAEL